MNRSNIDVMAVALVASQGSLIDNGSGAGRARSTPDPHAAWRSGVTVSAAPGHTTLGSPMPTKQFRTCANWRALAVIMIRNFEQPGSGAVVTRYHR